jgi:hypothetical protein
MTGERGAGTACLAPGMGEEFHRFDVGVAVHDPGGDAGVGAGVLFRADAALVA